MTDGAGAPIALVSRKGGSRLISFVNIPANEPDKESMIRLRHFEGARDQGIGGADLPYFVMRRPGGGAPLIVPGTTDLGHPETTFNSSLPSVRPVETPPGP